MSQIEKLMRRFNTKPTSIKYHDLEKILLYLEFEKIQAKGSHVKFKHTKLDSDIVIPVHNNDCKAFYKKQVKKQLQKIIK